MRSRVLRPVVRALRTTLFWCHLAVGVAAGLVVLVMSATGVLLTYQKQMTHWADLRAMPPVSAPAPGAARPALDSLVASARRAASGAAPTAITWRRGAGEPVEIAFGRERRLFVDPHTGVVLGDGSRRMRAFFRTTTDLHRWLAAKDARRPLGRSITGAANLGFLFLVVSGAVLWWPRNLTRATVRGALLFRRGLRGKARDFNWHNVIGAWSAVPLVVVVASGVVISYPWAGDLVYRAAGERPPARPAAEPAAAGRAATRAPASTPSLEGIETLLARAERRSPEWRAVTMQVPRGADAPIAFALDAGMGGQPQRRATVTLDRATGAETRWEPFGAQSPGRRLRSLLRFAHTGEVLGVPGQTLAGLVSLGAVVLVWTGLALSWRRLRGALGGTRRERTAVAQPLDRAA